MNALRKTFRVAALIFAVIAVTLAVAAVVLPRSLPYRIGPHEYGRYLWSVRLFWMAFIVPIAALLLGIASRQKLSITLAVVSWVFFFLFTPGFIHSGPNPQAWCYYNLRKIGSAKFQISSENHLPTGTNISIALLSNFIEGGFERLGCAEHGSYTVNTVGSEARCSVHGTMSEMEAGWKKRMHR